jgi:hypothetical protein
MRLLFQPGVYQCSSYLEKLSEVQDHSDRPNKSAKRHEQAIPAALIGPAYLP